MPVRGGSYSRCRRPNLAFTPLKARAPTAVQHKLSLMCDDIQATVGELRAKGITVHGEPEDHGYGIVVMVTLPGGVDLQVYEPGIRWPSTLPSAPDVTRQRGMAGSISIGYWIAHGAFWMLIVYAAAILGARRVAVFIALWLIGYAGSAWVQQGTTLFMSYVAMLDIALVLMVFKGDIRLT